MLPIKLYFYYIYKLVNFSQYLGFDLGANVWVKNSVSLSVCRLTSLCVVVCFSFALITFHQQEAISLSLMLRLCGRGPTLPGRGGGPLLVLSLP